MGSPQIDPDENGGVLSSKSRALVPKSTSMIALDEQKMDTRIAALQVKGREVVVEGRLCQVAHVDGEGYKFLADPESVIASLRGSDRRADLFTFLQDLPETSPRSPYPF